ncbi:uncharacterized protein LOC142165949 [Nicotiana tabacum]|uniref:Uncharacterized protein LOC142165949 n=1 Tax=Nicotiana tabacum TaxID=4097 RepID=A0AC58S624_TOBAC
MEKDTLSSQTSKRHIEANWCKRWKSGEMKKLLWWCAWSIYEEDFQDQLKNMGDMDEDAMRDLLHYPPQSWCRAYFDTVCKNMAANNNFTESFNVWILDARYKPIVKMLEDIRVKGITLLREHEVQVKSWTRDFSPQSMKLYANYLKIAHTCLLHFNGDAGYEIREGEDKHTVRMEVKQCSCRQWQLSGIPCPHTIKALIYKRNDPLEQMHWWYSKDAALKAYSHKLQPVKGEKF